MSNTAGVGMPSEGIIVSRVDRLVVFLSFIFFEQRHIAYSVSLQVLGSTGFRWENSGEKKNWTHLKEPLKLLDVENALGTTLLPFSNPRCLLYSTFLFGNYYWDREWNKLLKKKKINGTYDTPCMNTCVLYSVSLKKNSRTWRIERYDLYRRKMCSVSNRTLTPPAHVTSVVRAVTKTLYFVYSSVFPSSVHDVSKRSFNRINNAMTWR